jgi:transposase
MAQKRRKYTGEFKLEAVRLWQTTEKSAREVEDDLGIARGLLYRWKSQLTAKGEDAFNGQGRMSAPEEEIRRLKRELEIVKQERDILKKAVAIFSHPNE